MKPNKKRINLSTYKNESYILSDKSINYIKKYMITELNITKKIDNDILIDMVDLATNYECLLAEKETNSKLEFDEQKSLDSTDFVSEISGNWALNKEPNFNDLNSKLGL